MKFTIKESPKTLSFGDIIVSSSTNNKYLITGYEGHITYVYLDGLQNSDRTFNTFEDMLISIFSPGTDYDIYKYENIEIKLGL